MRPSNTQLAPTLPLLRRDPTSSGGFIPKFLALSHLSSLDIPMQGPYIMFKSNCLNTSSCLLWSSARNKTWFGHFHPTHFVKLQHILELIMPSAQKNTLIQSLSLNHFSEIEHFWYIDMRNTTNCIQHSKISTLTNHLHKKALYIISAAMMLLLTGLVWYLAFLLLWISFFLDFMR